MQRGKVEGQTRRCKNSKKLESKLGRWSESVKLSGLRIKRNTGKEGFPGGAWVKNLDCLDCLS